MARRNLLRTVADALDFANVGEHDEPLRRRFGAESLDGVTREMRSEYLVERMTQDHVPREMVTAELSTLSAVIERAERALARRQYDRDKRMRWRTTRIAEGKCVNCVNPLTDEDRRATSGYPAYLHHYCSRCANRESERSAKISALRRERKAAGLCQGCGEEPATRGKHGSLEFGPLCRARRTEYARTEYARDKARLIQHAAPILTSLVINPKDGTVVVVVADASWVSDDEAVIAVSNREQPVRVLAVGRGAGAPRVDVVLVTGLTRIGTVMMARSDAELRSGLSRMARRRLGRPRPAVGQRVPDET